MKLIIKISGGISLGMITWYLYQKTLFPRILQLLRKKQVQFKSIKKSLQNTKRSVQQLKKTLPLLTSNQQKLNCSLLQQEQLQLRKSIKKLVTKVKN